VKSSSPRRRRKGGRGGVDPLWHFWIAGDRDGAVRAPGRSTKRWSSRCGFPAKARATATAARIRMLGGDTRRRSGSGRRRSRWPELGLGESRRPRSQPRLVDRRARGLHGRARLEQAVEVARNANAASKLCERGANLAALCWTSGRLAEAGRIWLEAGRESEQYGQRGFSRWFRGVQVRCSTSSGTGTRPEAGGRLQSPRWRPGSRTTWRPSRTGGGPSFASAAARLRPPSVTWRSRWSSRSGRRTPRSCTRPWPGRARLPRGRRSTACATAGGRVPHAIEPGRASLRRSRRARALLDADAAGEARAGGRAGGLRGAVGADGDRV